MLSVLGSHLYQERRRLLFVASMAFLAGVLLYLPAPIYVGAVHISLISGVVYATVVGLAAFFVCLILPSMRFMIEAVAVSRLFFAFFVLAMPQIGFQILANPLLTALLVVAGGAAISRVLHGRILREGPRWQMPGRPRKPVRIDGNAYQHRIVAWLDDAAPIPA